MSRADDFREKYGRSIQDWQQRQEAGKEPDELRQRREAALQRLTRVAMLTSIELSGVQADPDIAFTRDGGIRKVRTGGRLIPRHQNERVIEEVQHGWELTGDYIGMRKDPYDKRNRDQAPLYDTHYLTGQGIVRVTMHYGGQSTPTDSMDQMHIQPPADDPESLAWLEAAIVDVRQRHGLSPQPPEPPAS